MDACYGIGSAIGRLIGGVLTSNISWRWWSIIPPYLANLTDLAEAIVIHCLRYFADDGGSFYINLPVGGAAVATIMLTFTTPKKAIPVKASLGEKLLQLNPTGVVLVMATVVCYLLALQWGGQSLPWSDSKVSGTLVGFVVITAAFVVEEQWMGERRCCSRGCSETGRLLWRARLRSCESRLCSEHLAGSVRS
jgi:MFS family permease